MPHSARRDPSIPVLERFLVSTPPGPAELPEVAALERAGLAAYASEFDNDPRLRHALLGSSARHLATKVELRRLLVAWNEAGIEVLVFKGFHLAEFVYPSTAARAYSDVDLLIEERNALKAAAIAGGLGWREIWHAQRAAADHSMRGPRYNGHEVVQLLKPKLGIQLDVHRRLVHNNHQRIRRSSRQEQITRMTWERSELVDWEGVSLRLPHPLDAVLVGLVLNRCWSSEDFELRSHDYLDFRYLTEKYGLELEALQWRAQELGCPKTFEFFLERCDPFERRCILTTPSRLDRQRWNLLVASERGNRYAERGWAAACEGAQAILTIALLLPGVVRTLVLVMRSNGLRAACMGLPQPRQRRPLSADQLRSMRRALHRCLRLLNYGRIPGQEQLRERDLEAVVLLAALRRRGVPATLRWSSSGNGRRPVLELDGKPLRFPGELVGR